MINELKIKETLNKNKQLLAIRCRERECFFVENATNKGFLVARVGDGIDLSYVEQNKRRGRVQKGMSQTITCESNIGVVVEK